MKKSYWFAVLIPVLALVFLLSCAGPPTLPKTGTTDTLTLSLPNGAPAASGSGAFYDYSQPSTTCSGCVTTVSGGTTSVSGGTTNIATYTETPFNFPGGPYSFSDQTHDTLGFAITITSGPVPVTFNYQLDGTSGSAVANPTYTSGRFSF
jgi:hypothetical protein